MAGFSGWYWQWLAPPRAVPRVGLTLRHQQVLLTRAEQPLQRVVLQRLQVAQAAPAAPAKYSDQALPPIASLAAWSHEIQKLVQAGVEERVITSYITNCAGMFNLTADQIIYLKNTGVSARVLSVMMQHDQQLFSRIGLMPPPAAAPAELITTFTLPGGSPVAASDESREQEHVVPADTYYAPEQPEGIGPVRARYAVKLNDPIIMLRVPTLTVPYW